jgi:hypothetical protein
MFLYNRGYQKTIDGVKPHGVIINASSIYQPSLSRRDSTYSSLNILLFDPQYYLSANLDRHTSQSTYLKLATYPWFNQNPPEYNSDEIKLKDWKKQLPNNPSCIITYPENDTDIKCRIKRCLSFQDSMGCSHLIIPVPLARTREEQFTEQLRWIKLGIEYKHTFTKPIIATLPFSEKVLSEIAFENNDLSQTILDYLPTIEELDGYYIAIEKETETMHIANTILARTLLELCYNLSKYNKFVCINFVDIFGIVCLAAGATAFGGGYTSKEKRLFVEDFVDRTGGYQYPKFYSNILLGDFYSERDLNKLVDLDLINYIYRDKTNYSASLIRAFKNRNTAKDVPEWEEKNNNVSTATRHRIENIVNLTNNIDSTNNLSTKLDFVYYYLEDAQARMGNINYRNTGNDQLSENGDHINIWLHALKDFRAQNSL